MKRLPALMILIAFFFVVKASATDPFDQKVVSSVPVVHPLLQKLFPGIEFRLETSMVSLPPHRRVVALSGNDRIIMPLEFNKLNQQFTNGGKNDINDLIEAYIRLRYWQFDPNLKIIRREDVDITDDGIKFNHRITARVKGVFGSARVHELELWIATEKDQIRRMDVHEAGRKMSSETSLFIGLETDNVTLTITGQDVVHEVWSNVDHYYIAVSVNNIATAHSITFDVGGLTPGSNNNQLKIIPMYGYNNQAFLDTILPTTDISGHS